MLTGYCNQEAGYCNQKDQIGCAALILSLRQDKITKDPSAAPQDDKIIKPQELKVMMGGLCKRSAGRPYGKIKRPGRGATLASALTKEIRAYLLHGAMHREYARSHN